MTVEIKNNWQCPKCNSYDLSFYGSLAICNNCEYSYSASIIYTDLDLK